MSLWLCRTVLYKILNFGHCLTVPCGLVTIKVLSHLSPWAQEPHFSSGLVLPLAQTRGQALDLCSSLVSRPVFGPFFYCSQLVFPDGSWIIPCFGVGEGGVAVDGPCYHTQLCLLEDSQ